MKKILILSVIIINSTLFFGQSVSKTIQLLPDTGQTQSYTTTFGEDQDYLINTPSFTNNNNGTITDNVTGLMWQQVDGGEMTIEDAITYCATMDGAIESACWFWQKNKLNVIADKKDKARAADLGNKLKEQIKFIDDRIYIFYSDDNICHPNEEKRSRRIKQYSF